MKMASLTYQFKKRSHEHQFHFNAELQGAFASVKNELDRLDPATPQDQSTILRARNQLDEGLKALATRQKFTKIAERSEFGWAAVKYYQSDPLASDSEDEKDLGRAEKEAKKDTKRQSAKHHRNKQPARPRRSTTVSEDTSCRLCSWQPGDHRCHI